MFSILYVDDDETLLSLNKIFLEKSGEFSVDTIHSAALAIGMIAGKSYHAIISDYDMPQMDGIALLKYVRQHHEGLPFLLFTGRGREEIVIEALNNGADFYIQKGPDLPGMIAELKHKLTRAIERRRTEDALRKSQQQLTDIINFLPDATFVIDTRGYVIAWNRAMEQMTGILRKDIVGKGDHAYAIPFFGERCPLVADSVLSGLSLSGSSFASLLDCDNRISCSVFAPRINDGKGAHLLVSAGPLFDQGGTLIGAIETVRNVTDIQKIRRDLTTLQEKNLGLINMLPVAVVEMDLFGNLRFANSVAAELFGIGPEEKGGDLSIFEYVSLTEHERVLTALKAALHGKPASGSEFILRKHDGSTFPAMVYGELIVDPETNGPDGFRVVVIDMTRNRKQEQELDENQKRLKLAVEAGNLGIWDVNIPKQEIHDISTWITRVLGYQLDQPVVLIEKTITLIHPLDLPGIILAFRRYVAGEAPLFECRFRARCRDGRWITVVVRGQVIERDRNGDPARMTGIVYEVNTVLKSILSGDLNEPAQETMKIRYNP